MTRDYLGSRLVLSLAVVLVDCTRGLCAADISMLKYLQHQHPHHRLTSSSSIAVGTIDNSPSGVPWLVVLTKCDLMSPTMVARSILATEQDLIANGLGLGLGSEVGPDYVNDEDGDEVQDGETRTTLNQTTSYQGMVVPVSAATGAGVQRLWLRLLHHARLSTIDHTDSNAPSQSIDSPSQINPFAVREHRNAALLRKQDYLRQLSRFRKT